MVSWPATPCRFADRFNIEGRGGSLHPVLLSINCEDPIFLISYIPCCHQSSVQFIVFPPTIILLHSITKQAMFL